MELTLYNYKTALPKELLSQSKKATIRECDETEKGHFVAYADEGSDSFDVSLTISNKTIKAHSCDCNTGVPYYEEQEKDRQNIPQLLQALLKHYTADELRKAITQFEKERYYHRPDHFVRYMKEQLMPAGK